MLFHKIHVHNFFYFPIHEFFQYIRRQVTKLLHQLFSIYLIPVSPHTWQNYVFIFSNLIFPVYNLYNLI